MKKLLALSVLIIVALVVFKAPEKVESKQVQQEKREEVKLLPVSEIKKAAEELKAEVKETGTVLEVKEARKEFKSALKGFKEVTREYNEKAIAGIVTPEDEKQYQVSMEKSLKAFRTYQDAVLKELNLKKEI